MSDFIMAIKQMLRPLIPDAVMARYRVRQHSLAMRSNVDVFLPSGRDAKRWLHLTPDTFESSQVHPKSIPYATAFSWGRRMPLSAP